MSPRNGWPGRLRRYLPALLAGLIGSGLSTALFTVARSLVTGRTEHEFERRAGNMLGTLRFGLRADLQALYWVRNLFLASEVVTPAEFRDFVGDIHERNPGIRALAWVPRVPLAARAEFEAAMSSSLGRAYRIRAIPGGEAAGAVDRGALFPIAYFEPLSGNEGALGVDLGTSEVRLEALRRARMSGAAAATPIGGLVTGGTGFEIYLPVAGGVAEPDGITADGYVAGVFQLDQVIETSLSGLEESIDFLLVPTRTGGEEPRAYRYDASRRALEAVPADWRIPAAGEPLQLRSVLEVNGLRWTVILYATPEFIEIEETAEPWYALGGGLLLTGLLTGYLVSASRRAERMAAINAELGAEASRRQRAQRELRTSEEEQRFLAEAGETMVSSLDDDEMLRSIARHLIPRLADWVLVHVVEVEGAYRRVALFGRDPAADRRLEALVRRYPPTTIDERTPIGRALRTGEPQFHPELTDEEIEAFARDEEERRAFRAEPPRSILTVPLVARGRTLGAITLVRMRDRPPLAPRDLVLAMELARRAALAVDNARLFVRAEIANEVKTDFLAVVSHELRTPLNAIIGFTEILTEGIAGPLDPEQLDTIRRIGRSAEHLRDLIDEVLSFSRIDTSREQIRPAQADAGELARSAVAAAQPFAREKRLELRVSVPEEPTPLRTDPEKVRQILRNLLSNAIKFTDRGSIEVRVRAEADTVVIEIEDTGIGIAPEDVDRIFDPFWQVERGPTRRAGGTGLGLSVSRRFARLLGGDVTVESVPGRGSTFTVRLPRVAKPPTGTGTGTGRGRGGGPGPDGRRREGRAGPRSGVARGLHGFAGSDEVGKRSGVPREESG